MVRIMSAISVIMPVYNTAPYLRRALDSVCRQTFKDLEILCIDDGSTDESVAILGQYASRDPRIRVITHEKNCGYASAINTGLAEAMGEAVGFVDSDDVISKNFFAELWKVYKIGGCDIAKGRMKKQDLDGLWREYRINDAIRKDQRNFTWQWTSAIYSIEFIRKHRLSLDLRLNVGQDVLFLHRAIAHGPIMGFSENSFYYYLRNGASMRSVAGRQKELKDRISLRLYLKEYFPSYPPLKQRMLFEMIIQLLYNDTIIYKDCDWKPLLEIVQAILADDKSYASQKEFPFLRHALKAENVEELEAALQVACKCIDMKSLRAKVRGSN